jgi:hypothetical protein
VLKKLLLIGSLLALPASVYAQAARSVVGGGSSIWAGGGFSDFTPDYGPARTFGADVYVDYNLFPKLGAEGEARWLHWNGNGGSTEQLSNYLIGPRYRAIRFHHLSVWGKFLMGAGLENYPSNAGNGSYFAYTPGVDAEYAVTHRISVRGGYEYQFWPSAPGAGFVPAGSKSSGLTPNGYTVGFTYRLLGH